MHAPLGLRLLHRELEALARRGALPDGLQPRRDPPPPRRAARAGACGCAGSGARPRLWRSVIKELEVAEELTRHNDVLTLTMCVNYGGRAEIADAARRIARRRRGRPAQARRDRREDLARHLDEPDMPDVDLFVRTLGGAAHLELPAVAVAPTPRWSSWTRSGPTSTAAHLWAGDRDLRRRATAATAAPSTCPRPRRSRPLAARRTAARRVSAAQLAQVPKISRVCCTSVKPCSRADLVGPALDRRALDLDRARRTTRQTRWWWWPVAAARGRPPRRRRCAACRPRRRRPAPAGCGRPWPARPSRPCRAAARGSPGRSGSPRRRRAASRRRRAAGSGAAVSAVVLLGHRARLGAGRRVAACRRQCSS